MKKLYQYPILATLALLLMCTGFQSCEKEASPSPAAPSGQLQINLSHAGNAFNLVYDSLLYRNAAGNRYEVTLLEYYISEIKLSGDNSEAFQSSEVFYINPKLGKSNVVLSNVPTGNFTSISFTIGVQASKNISYSLEPTPENINMQWPEPIGGGYHIMKFEGRYLDSANVLKGFAMHLGTTEMLVKHKPILANLSVKENQKSMLNLQMDINEWFTLPYNYDFTKDGNYTMAIVPLMTILKNNGNDVFSIKN